MDQRGHPRLAFLLPAGNGFVLLHSYLLSLSTASLYFYPFAVSRKNPFSPCQSLCNKGNIGDPDAQAWCSLNPPDEGRNEQVQGEKVCRLFRGGKSF